MKFLEKARAKKAQPDNKVDVLSQLEVGEGEKKKRKASDARISAGKAIEAGETQVKSPTKKKSRTLKKTRKDAETSVLEKEVRETDDVVVEVSPAVEEDVTAVANQAGGSSP
jgi:hypothetical protein